MRSCYTIPVDNTCAIADVCDYYGTGMILTRINVPAEARGKGIGSKLLNEVTSAADVEGIVLYLEINPYGPLNYDALEAWYFRNGFKKWNGIYRRLPKKVPK